MFKKVNEQRDIKAQNYIINAKEEFKKYIPRDTIESIGVTECVEKEGLFEFNGPVAATSPTGKEKTFRYTASVDVNTDGVCSIVKLQVTNL